MKLIVILGFLLGFFLVPLCSFGQDIAFGYDESGNRVERKVIALQAPAAIVPGDETANDRTTPVLYRELKVYPNPTLGQVRVELPFTENDAPFTYRVLTATGQVILSGQSASGAADFDLSAQPVGIYFVTLRNASTSYNLQIVKQ